MRLVRSRLLFALDNKESNLLIYERATVDEGQHVDVVSHQRGRFLLKGSVVVEGSTASIGGTGLHQLLIHPQLKIVTFRQPDQY